jgi:hypothetical protein
MGGNNSTIRQESVVATRAPDHTYHMAKKREPVDDLLDALVWMRRKTKKRQPVDYLVDALLSMRKTTKKKTRRNSAIGKRTEGKRK